jgi:hypothetical protein
MVRAKLIEMRDTSELLNLPKIRMVPESWSGLRLWVGQVASVLGKRE